MTSNSSLSYYKLYTEQFVTPAYINTYTILKKRQFVLYGSPTYTIIIKITICCSYIQYILKVEYYAIENPEKR